MAEQDDDNIPLLDEVVRQGNGEPKQPQGKQAGNGRGNDEPGLSDAEIEAIANRVVERYTRAMQQAVARAIRQALQVKARQQGSRKDDSGESGQ